MANPPDLLDNKTAVVITRKPGGQLTPYERLLANIQGHILKDHGRDYSLHVVVQFLTPELGRSWIQDFARHVTSAIKQNEDSAKFKTSKKKLKDIPFVAFYLSAAGYRHLGLQNAMPNDFAFQSGMASSKVIVTGKGAQGWQKPYQNEIHAMVLIANDIREKAQKGYLTRDGNSRLQLDIKRRYLLDDNQKRIAKVLTLESGDTKYQGGDRNKPQEHFGFVDGISNPMFLQDDLDNALNKREQKQSYEYFDAFRSLNHVLVRESADPFECGSFLAFLKLEQKVERFEKLVKRLAAKRKDNDVEKSAALVVGRYRDGQPLEIPRGEKGSTLRNDFIYQDSGFGTRCPLAAHIRKTSPRRPSASDPNKPISLDEKRRIARRGITYSYQKEKGLLFLSFQDSISDNFEFILEKWATDDRFSATGVGQDPIIGKDTFRNIPQEWPTDSGNPINLAFGACIKMRGGEYFFAPSISFLSRIVIIS